MRPTMLAFGATFILAIPVTAQAPPRPITGNAAPAQFPALGSATAPLTQSPPAGPLQRFDNTSLRLTAELGKWQLWAGSLLLKDFGPAERDAAEAVQVLRDLRVNSHASIGGVFEYWLADGQAPYSLTGNRRIVPFDPKSLRVEQINGQWVLRDAHVVLYGFGSAEADARQALAVCRQYEFNQLGYVGHPTPAMKYLMRDPTPPPAGPATQNVQPVSAVMQPSELARPRLVLHGVGDVGDRVPFDGRHLDLRREGGEWVLSAGRTIVGRFGPADYEARAALITVEQFRVTELCRIGESGFGFFLANGRAPQGSIVGTGATQLRSELLNVRQVGGSWAVCEDSRPLFDFGDKADDARHALAAIKEFRFDHVTQVGNGRLGNVYLFIKTRN